MLPRQKMQKDKTVMLGANFMNKEITPPTWYYHTYNYYLNVTILPWMEVAYTCTLFKAEALGLNLMVTQALRIRTGIFLSDYGH